MTKRHFLPDICRVIAVSSLIICHVSLQSGVLFDGFLAPLPLYSTDLGNGVSLFIIVSGLSLSLKPRSKIKLSRFLLSRFWRIMPTYWLSFCIGCIVYFGFNIVNPALTRSIPQITEPLHLFCSIMAICPLFSVWGGFILPTGWFVLTIFLLYTIYPLLYQMVKREAVVSLIAAGIVSYISLKMTKSHISDLPLWTFRWFPLSHIFEFVLGIFLGTRLQKNQPMSYVSSNNFGKFITHIAEISFPLFLVHYPLLFVIKSVYEQGFNRYVSLTIYLVLIYVTSLVVYKLAPKLTTLMMGTK